ncbi:hypothetical protein NEOLEDRAFT_1154386 [Neolentinus lepideus HHB14362 ss-1]|uniref:Knr4/Smi1-like domain-containing protein n=1 Tax=Neolentinus lepideus HHB14362 ss-1 TaxID=1314782 RepID=A0A165UNW3_9AGAM|nr:hypothetical protein NEOLEDRAFT_1154386 [Neolentinus lepideus HHB14362 ss-1]
MSWFTSLFSSDSSRRKNQAMSSTHEAFSLPTSSPVFPNHSDALRADTPYTPDPETASSPYTYPPPSVGSIYDYLPTSGSRSRPTSLLPIHNKPLSPLPPYPPLAQTWHRLQTWLMNEYPELGDTLNYGILPQDLAQIEMQFGFQLPVPVRESYLVCDGQEPESSAGCSEGLFFGLTLLPLEEVLEEWRFWRDVDDDPNTGANPKLRDAMQSIPPDYVRKEYSCKGWIPLVADKAGNYLGIDLNPGEGGAPGQVIIFGRDFDTKVVMWRGDGPSGWAKWLASFVEELESGEGYEIGNQNDGSEGSEDDIGYGSYFYDGSGRGQGDGGGDAGPGGLRLTGEYRGWNVLEAWADKSVRKWLESGLVTEESFFPSAEKGKRRESVIELAGGLGKQSDAEVPIPVLADIDENLELTPSQNGVEKVNVNQLAAPRVVPTISVTKPPIPLPVDLPTQDDLSTPSSPDSAPSSPLNDDLESGRGMMMKEVDLPPRQPLVRSQVAPSSNPNGAVNGSLEASLVPLPTPPSGSSGANSLGTTPPALSSGMADITDLLAESAPALEAQPIEPVASPSRALATEPLPDVTDAFGAAVNSDSKDEAATIRLVGDGGISGTSEEKVPPTVNGDIQLDGEAEGAELTAVTTRSSESSTSSKKGHGKKKSSVSSLKKFGKLGGKRKKDSASSIQDVV